MRFFPTLFGGSRVETKDDTTIRAAAAGPRYISWGQPLPLYDWDIERLVADGYERVIWLWRAIDAIADRAASLPIRVIKGEPGDPATMEFSKDPLLDVLNYQASEWERARDFRYRLSSQLLLSKPGVFVEVRLNNGGGVFSLSLLPPHRTRPIPDPDTFISGFRVDLSNGYSFDLPPWRPGTKEEVSVLWIRKPHPIDPYSGTTPLEAAGISIDLDFWSRLYNRNFMAHDGRPGGVLAIKGEVDDEDAEELRARFSGGPSMAGRTAVIEADDVAWVDTAMSPRDAQYVQSRALTKEEILLALGVPETIIGNASGRTYDNADSERDVFWQETMQSHLSLLENGLEGLTQGGYDDDLRLWHDVSTVDVLKRSQEKRQQALQGEYDRGLITIAEYREATGRDPVNAAGARVLWIPGGKVPVGEKKDQDEAEKLTAIGPGGGAAAGGGAPGPGLAPGQNHPGSPPQQPGQQRGQDQVANSRRGAIQGSQIGAQLAATQRSLQSKADQPDFTDSSMVALLPDRATVAQVAPFAQRGDLHCTLAFLGSVLLDSNEQQRVEQAVGYSLGRIGPLTGTVSAVIDFPAGPDGTPTVLLLDVPGLNEVRADLVRALEMVGVPQRSEHGFTAHLTLGYDLNVEEAQALVNAPVRFDRVQIAFGPEAVETPLVQAKTAHASAWV